MADKVLVHFFNLSYRYYEKSEYLTPPLPYYSTQISPPLLICGEGYVPIFTLEKKWVIVKDEFWKPQSVVKCYSSGDPKGSYKPFMLSFGCGDFPMYPSFPQINYNSGLPILISNKIRNIHKKYDELLTLYRKLKQPQDIMLATPIEIGLKNEHNFQFYNLPADIYEYHFLAEELVMNMKSVIDYLVQLTSIMTNYEESTEKKAIIKSELGNIGAIKQPKTDLDKVIVGDTKAYACDGTDFLIVINELTNSIKHSMLHFGIFNLEPNKVPAVFSYQAKSNKFSNNIIYHAHDIEQLMIGFKRNVTRIIDNQKKYLSSMHDITNG